MVTAIGAIIPMHVTPVRHEQWFSSDETNANPRILPRTRVILTLAPGQLPLQYAPPHYSACIHPIMNQCRISHILLPKCESVPRSHILPVHLVYRCI